MMASTATPARILTGAKPRTRETVAGFHSIFTRLRAQHQLASGVGHAFEAGYAVPDHGDVAHLLANGGWVTYHRVAM